MRFKGKSIADVLEMSVEEALEFFAKIPKIRRRLQTLHDVGLDYIKLGQPATTLSGGEAQRVKLAAELSKVATGRTLYILDEPTTGLHFADIEKLLEVLQRLVDAGNTVLVIEHNLDVIKQADWVIDLGPEGGEEGGELIAAGTPEEIAEVEGSLHRAFPPRVLAARGCRSGRAAQAVTVAAQRGASRRSSHGVAPSRSNVSRASPSSGSASSRAILSDQPFRARARAAPRRARTEHPGPRTTPRPRRTSDPAVPGRRAALPGARGSARVPLGTRRQLPGRSAVENRQTSRRPLPCRRAPALPRAPRRFPA